MGGVAGEVLAMPGTTGVADVAVGAGGVGGGAEQAHKALTMAMHSAAWVVLGKIFNMWLLLLEALGALALLVFLVWWTLFSGRDKGERKR
jgi:hypothetical protein